MARRAWRPVQLRAARRRRDRVREVPASNQFNRARHAAARAQERPHRARRPLRHGRLPARRLRRATGLHARGAGTAARVPGRDWSRRRLGMTVDLVLVGFGHVARRFVTLLDEMRAALVRDFGLTTRIVAVSTRGHGRAYAGRGLPGASLVDARARGQTIGSHGPDLSTPDFIRAIARKTAAADEGRLVMVETTTLDIDEGQPAIDHVRAALACGAHVVTANKGPVAFGYESLAQAAAKAGRLFRFEGAVMDGIPIFNL